LQSPSGMQWDDGNLTKCQAHGVSLAEISEVFEGEPYYVPDERHSHVEPRLLAIGKTRAGRAVFVAFTIREQDGQRLARPISARYMHRKEAKRYDQFWRTQGSGDDD